jgi:outer membrane protein OmpA-like peptidoglycan-associated protein
VSSRVVTQATNVPAAPQPQAVSLQRQCACGQHTLGGGACSDCEKKNGGAGSGAQKSFPGVPSIVSEVASSAGQPLDHTIQNFFSRRFAHDFSGIRVHASRIEPLSARVGPVRNRLEDEADRMAEGVMAHQPADSAVDFSDVRLHTDSRAAESARAVNARAYTLGRNVVFGKDEYQPNSSQGRRLLAHELAHVLQQSDGGAAQVQREVFETDFPGGGKVEEERTGMHRIWNFDVGQSTLKPEHLTAIKDLAKTIKESLNPSDAEEQVDLEGQASSTGTAKSNEALAQRRAQAVKKALMDESVPESKIRITVVGEAKSEVGTTQENFARSRAVRVLFVPRTKLARPATPPTQTGCQPGINGNDLPLDIIGDKVGLTVEGTFIVLRAGTTATPGITITASPMMTPRNCGELSFVQNVLTFRQIVYKDGSRNTFESADFVLDGGDPYNCTPGPLIFTALDGPGMGVNVRQQPRISTMEVREDFRMFLMFQPDGGQRRTHQVAEWRWVGQAKNKDPRQDKGDLELDTSVSRITPQAGSGFFTSAVPALSPNVGSLPWVTDTSANPAKDSDAARLVDGLNKARPPVKIGKPCPRPKPKTQPGTTPPPATPNVKDKI